MPEPRPAASQFSVARATSSRSTPYLRSFSTSVVRRKPEAGGDYNVALVDLEEGVRLMSRVDGLAPGAVRIGMAVQARVRSDGAEPSLVFVAREEA